MSGSHLFLKIVRQIHLYAGVFIAPALLFFALTGGLQVFGLHEASRNGDYRPPVWLATLAQLHKKQTTVIPLRRARPMDDEHQATPATLAFNHTQLVHPQNATPSRRAAASVSGRHPLPLKIFSAFVALGLFVSTLIGIYMAYRYTRKRMVVTALLLAGTILPVVLALI